MKALRLAVFAGLVAISTALSGCAIGNRGEITYNNNVSRGQELMDLKTARDSGAITDQEYQSQKEKVMRGEMPEPPAKWGRK